MRVWYSRRARSSSAVRPRPRRRRRRSARGRGPRRRAGDEDGEVADPLHVADAHGPSVERDPPSVALDGQLAAGGVAGAGASCELAPSTSRAASHAGDQGRGTKVVVAATRPSLSGNNAGSTVMAVAAARWRTGPRRPGRTEVVGDGGCGAQRDRHLAEMSAAPGGVDGRCQRGRGALPTVLPHTLLTGARRPQHRGGVHDDGPINAEDGHRLRSGERLRPCRPIGADAARRQPDEQGEDDDEHVVAALGAHQGDIGQRGRVRLLGVAGEI